MHAIVMGNGVPGVVFFAETSFSGACVHSDLWGSISNELPLVGITEASRRDGDE
jgi:hypothetical protein